MEDTQTTVNWDVVEILSERLYEKLNKAKKQVGSLLYTQDYLKKMVEASPKYKEWTAEKKKYYEIPIPKTKGKVIRYFPTQTKEAGDPVGAKDPSGVVSGVVKSFYIDPIVLSRKNGVPSFADLPHSGFLLLESCLPKYVADSLDFIKAMAELAYVKDKMHSHDDFLEYLHLLRTKVMPRISEKYPGGSNVTQINIDAPKIKAICDRYDALNEAKKKYDIDVEVDKTDMDKFEMVDNPLHPDIQAKQNSINAIWLARSQQPARRQKIQSQKKDGLLPSNVGKDPKVYWC